MKEPGDSLTVVVTSDKMAIRYKGHDPERPSQENRCAAIRRLGYEAVVGDETEGTYTAVRSSNEDTIIFVGYDQNTLEEDLRKRMRDGLLPQRTIQKVSDYCGDLYHTTILRRNKLQAILWRLMHPQSHRLLLSLEQQQQQENKPMIVVQAGTGTLVTRVMSSGYHCPFCPPFSIHSVSYLSLDGGTSNFGQVYTHTPAPTFPAWDSYTYEPKIQKG